MEVVEPYCRPWQFFKTPSVVEPYCRPWQFYLTPLLPPPLGGVGLVVLPPHIPLAPLRSPRSVLGAVSTSLSPTHALRTRSRAGVLPQSSGAL